MTNIELGEISGVDYPAHMVNGFAIIKSESQSSNRALASALRKENMPEKTVEEVLAGLSADELRKALAPEVLAELAPAPVEKAAEEDILKGLSPEVRAEFEKRDAEIAKANEKIQKAEEAAEIAKAARLDGEAITKSKETYTNLGFEHEKVAPALRKFAGVDAEAATSIETMLKAVNAQADGAVFKELGTNTPSDTDASATDQLNDLAKARATKDGVPFHKAYAEVVKENPELVSAHFKEGSN